MKTQPLTELELYELLVAAYPEKFGDRPEDNQLWEDVLEWAEDLDINDLLGRVVMLTTPQRSPLSGKLYHALGPVFISKDTVSMTAAVKREATA